MEFPWTAVGVVLAATTLSILLIQNIPKLVKNVISPRMVISLYVYPKKYGEQSAAIQKEEQQILENEVRINPEVSPEISVLLKPKWKYTIDRIEALGYGISKIHSIDLFAQERFWLENEYSDIEGNYKACPHFAIAKTDSMILDYRLSPPFKKGEERKFTVKIRTAESRKEKVKDFLIKAS
jgi:hypothetical protein